MALKGSRNEKMKGNLKLKLHMAGKRNAICQSYLGKVSLSGEISKGGTLLGQTLDAAIQ